MPNKPRNGRKSHGRKAGVPNLHNKIVKDCALIAVELSRHSNGDGLVGYLTFMANEYPVAFTRSILSKLLPIQLALRADVTQRLESVEEVRAKLRERGIPVDKLATLFEVPRTPAKVIDMLPLLPRRETNGSGE